MIFKMNFQNFQKRVKNFKKQDFFFYQQIFLNLPQDLRHMISLKAQAAGEAK